MWQPYNGLEVFDPTRWVLGAQNSSLFDLPPTCQVAAHACIPGAPKAMALELGEAASLLATPVEEPARS